MTSPTRTSISSFPRGHEFPAVEFTISSADLGAYLDAVGDRNDYGGAVPPLCAVARALNALQEQIALPEGSLHTGQEVEHLSLVPAGQPLQLSGRIAQRSERQGFVISVIEFEVAASDGVALRARATIMAPGSAS
ncbi:MAG: MaoC family dehydratase [Chloroflexota bacterium]|nr:MaoC family dehydratase [Chloroflexota bacterium]